MSLHTPTKALLAICALSLASCGTSAKNSSNASEAASQDICAAPTPVKQFLDRANADLKRITTTDEQMNWKYMTDINDETEAAVTAYEEKMMAEQSAIIAESLTINLDDVKCEDQKRQLKAIQTSPLLPPPKDPAKQQRAAELSAKLMGYYGAAKSCDGDTCRDLGVLSQVVDHSTDEAEIRKAWLGWHNAFDTQKSAYVEFVSISNEGARDIGYNDTSELWLAGYDMPSKDFQDEINALWNDLKPLYDELHCYVRAKLGEVYGTDIVPQSGPIPAHLLGNMWAQEWTNIYPLVMPYKDAPNIDATPKMVESGMTPVQLFETVEKFYTSLGLRDLPKSFWTNSMFVKPEGKEVVCHASAWDLDTEGDVRIKMCTDINYDNLLTVQHEMGHIYYYLYYNHLPFIYQNGANDGFHEGIGDTITLSVTPKYLHDIGLLDEVSSSYESTINQQMQSALEKVAFLPFGLLIDEWRWRVFDGTITPENYNAGWWKLREELQGVKAPELRDESHFDAGAKYHVPGNTPYLRYFIARILQFQFHKALCEAAGFKGPLHECSIYGSKEAGAKLMSMLSKGASQPWQKTLEEVTGSPKMSAAPMLEYYAPLIEWLKKENAGRTCGY